MAGVSNSARSQKDKRDANSERATRRRAVLRTVHDVREQLNSQDGYRPSFRHELMMMYAKYALVRFLAYIIISSWRKDGL